MPGTKAEKHMEAEKEGPCQASRYHPPSWQRKWRGGGQLIRRRTVRIALLLTLVCLYSAALPWDLVSGSPEQVPGCEGYQVDACGVCGGDASSCEVISGTYSHSILSVGYHKILEIPLGAQDIKIQETTKSRNYLALLTQDGQPNRTRSRPSRGVHHCSGTHTTHELHLYVIYQQPDPSVYYHYILPKETLHSPEPAPANLCSPRGDHGAAHADAPEQLSPYGWRRTGSTLCSATCGSGRRQGVLSCVEQESAVVVPDDLCEHSQSPVQEEDCNTQPLPWLNTLLPDLMDVTNIFHEGHVTGAHGFSVRSWDVGEWSECSKSCGPGAQRRQVLCRQPLGNGSISTVGLWHCRHLEQPETMASCQLKICMFRAMWGGTAHPGTSNAWTNLGDVVMDEECNMKLRPEDVRNCDMGTCARSWFLTRWSDTCSAECGGGSRSRAVVCLMNHISSLPLDGCGDERPEELMPCDLGPCQHKPDWYTGSWGQCSSECGFGTQSRSVVCLLHNNGSFEVTAPSDCAHLPRPPESQPCQIKRCGAKWYVTEWSTCSRSCEGGYQVRDVRCLADNLTESKACDPFLMPEDHNECNTQLCIPEIDENCRDMYFNCNMVVQARLCVYSYYRTACCASCTRVREAGLSSR
ncbi:hypothetical protein SKAU_G00034260 [Synaphobranchus kaupii]|uniref:PLAC domain-containing protein n=1 Tax=Synaphobranchus kaupii TaxID=118154 RepID=A0A9Q1JEJ3_SYNKA|nr:hypothetical protein SKAU_G00034260 [Synaphobranchus kaupii]